MPGKPRNIAGKRFSRLVAISYVESRNENAYWLCRCDCGKEKIVRSSSLTSGATRSCGCLHDETANKNIRAAIASNTKTGISRSPTYTAWYQAIQRCEDPTSDGYQFYGGRGISVCERWHEFENFLADMGEKPNGLMIDRINNDGNYEPGNCRWTTIIVNMNNRRSNRFLTFRGRTRTVADWASVLGMPYNVLRGRIWRGWPVDKALTTPVGGRLPHGSLNGTDRKPIKVNANTPRCGNGHPQTPENIYVYRGKKKCKECGRRRARAHYRRSVGKPEIMPYDET